MNAPPDWADVLASVRCATCEGSGFVTTRHFVSDPRCLDCDARAKGIRKHCVPKEEHDKLKARVAELAEWAGVDP